MRRPRRTLTKLYAAPPAKRRMALRVLGALLWATVLVRLVPARCWLPRLDGPLVGRSSVTSTPLPADVGRVVPAVARRLPWKCSCLIQAVAGKRVLRHYGVDSTLCLGVRPGEASEAELRAHAWLRVGPDIVLGEAAATGYRALVCYGESGAL